MITLALALSVSLANLREIREVQHLKVGNTEYKLWQFSLKEPARCPNFLMLQRTEGPRKELVDRTLKSCSGIGRLVSDGKKLLVIVPSDDNSAQTFEYTYVYAHGKWLDKGR